MMSVRTEIVLNLRIKLASPTFQKYMHVDIPRAEDMPVISLIGH